MSGRGKSRSGYAGVGIACVAAFFGLVAGALLATVVRPQSVRYAGPGWQATAASTVSHDGPYPKLDVFAKVLSYVKNNYVEEVDDSTLVYGAVRGMVATLDPHTVFLDPAEFQSLRAGTTGEFGGLGIELEERNGEITVLVVMEHTPASRAGIQPGDVIRAIDGEPTRLMSLAHAAVRLRGLARTQVTLRLWRPAFAEPRDVVLVRDRIRVESVAATLLDGSVGHVAIKNFQERTDEELGKALAKLRTQAGRNWKGLVLDLRNNPGGLLEQGVRVADRFLSKGTIVTTRGRDGRNTEQETAVAKGTEPDYPVVVLVNAGTASASEIVAGALQDHDRAVLFGTPTYGKGSVQTVIELDDGSALKLTIARYYTPAGRLIQESGISPDVTVVATAEERAFVTEAALPGHMANDGSGTLRPVESVEAERVLSPAKPGAGPSDPQLDAAVRALAAWKPFTARLAAERSRARR